MPLRLRARALRAAALGVAAAASSAAATPAAAGDGPSYWTPPASDAPARVAAAADGSGSAIQYAPPPGAAVPVPVDLGGPPPPPAGPGTPIDLGPAAAVSADVWWSDRVRQPMRPRDPAVVLTAEGLLVRALNYSSQIQVFSELPLIRETAIVEADSAFDWTAFYESRWDDINDPVGNTLTVGGDGDRFNDHNLYGSAGLRKRTLSGGRLEVGQRFGWQDTNSVYFLPDQQGTARLSVSFTQPLMRGRGRVYNESLKVLACIDAAVADAEFSRQLQSHLLEVVRAYWGLYLERGVCLQKRAAAERAAVIFTRLQRRRGIDAFESQIVSAEADLKTLRADLKRSEAAVRNAEDRVRSLVNDPALEVEGLELIPADDPSVAPFAITMPEALSTAVRHRPEVTQALKQISAACVRVDMSKNELLPVLNLVTESYVSGLEGEGRSGRAFGSQFSDGRPSYSIGVQFEAPLGNRAARARHIRRCHELRQLQRQYATTVSTLKLETRVAVRELQTSYDELETRLASLTATKAKSDTKLRRWELMPTEGPAGSYVLEDLLAAQGQLARAESDYLTSVVTYNLALINLKRATGLLLTHERVHPVRTMVNGLPTMMLDKSALVGRPYAAPALGDGSALPPAPTH